MLKENKNIHYHRIFNFQHSSPESLQLYHSIRSSIFRPLILRLIDMSQCDILILHGLQIDNGIR